MMPFSLPPLPYAKDAFGAVISADTFAQHHGKHHQAYVDKLNKAAKEEGMEDADLLTIIRETADADPEDVSEQVEGKLLFPNAAQHFNHCFYWKSLSPETKKPSGTLLERIERDFGSVDELKERMIEEGKGHFASGWVWLCSDEDAELIVMSGHDAQTPVIDEQLKPLLVVDLWEHAFYLDHQSAKPDYLEAVVKKHLDWDFAARALEADGFDALDLGIGRG
jgi:Fe-Mn family superoxide dismutase